jgi:mannosidase alpha-like ER degradation enhancer 2
MKIVHNGYALRPEIVQSAYYLHHFTGDARYLDMGRTLFDSLMKYCRTDSGLAAQENVENKTQRDEMESFFLAESMKYLYLLFSPPNKLDLTSHVFDTEAHPIHRTW